MSRVICRKLIHNILLFFRKIRSVMSSLQNLLIHTVGNSHMILQLTLKSKVVSKYIVTLMFFPGYILINGVLCYWFVCILGREIKITLLPGKLTIKAVFFFSFCRLPFNVFCTIFTLRKASSAGFYSFCNIIHVRYCEISV